MANQVYFPHYKQIFDADPAAFILISHPETGLAYKIRVDALQEALTNSLISVDANNALVIGSDGLLFVEELDTLYSADGTLASNRTVSGNGKDLSISGVKNYNVISTSALNHTALNNPASANTNLAQSTSNIELLTKAGAVSNNSISLNEGGIAGGIFISSVTDNITLTVTSGNYINLAIPAGAELQLSGSAGNGGEVLQTNGALTPPIWKKVKYTHPFVIADWGAGTTLTIAAATHGLGASYHNVTVFDATHNIVPIAAVMTNVNVSSSSGDVVLTIVNNAAAFDGFAYITV
jgi:hypothetical protein